MDLVFKLYTQKLLWMQYLDRRNFDIFPFWEVKKSPEPLRKCFFESEHEKGVPGANFLELFAMVQEVWVGRKVGTDERTGEWAK